MKREDAFSRGHDGTIYAATRSPDRIIQIDPATGAVKPVVGTGTSGYNGSTDDNGPLAGPQGGFNNDGHPATATLLKRPLGVAATRSALILIADTENKRVRQAGPGAVTLGEGLPEVLVACRSGQTWSCRRLSTPAGPIATESKGTVTISQQGIVLATGRWFLSAPGRLLLHITEHQPLVPRPLRPRHGPGRGDGRPGA